MYLWLIAIALPSNTLRYVPEHAEDDTDYKSTLDELMASIKYLKNNELHLRRFKQAYST